MKKFLLLLIMLAAMLPWATNAQETVTIGTGTGTAYYTPFNSLWGYSFVEAIYTASEIQDAGGAPGTISAISFQKASGTGQTNNIVLYMKNVQRSDFSSTSDWEPVTANDIVYSGSWTIPTTGWTTITLDVPFVYDGSNLLIAMHENTSGYTTQYFYYTAATNSIISFHSDSSDPDPYNLSAWSGTTYTQSNRSNIQLELTSGTITCHSTGAVSASNITATDATVSWGASVDPGNPILQYKTSNETWDSPNVITVYPTDTTYNFSGTLSPITTYNVRVANVCTPGDTSIWRSTTFTTECAPMTQLPYIQYFDNYGTGTATAYPPCWSKYSTYTASSALPYISSTHFEGTGSLYLYVATSGTYNTAIAPPFDASIPINTLQASFMYRASNSTDRLIVGVMDSPTDPTSFVPVDTVMPGSSPTQWEEREVNFSSYEGTGQYIAFMNHYTTTNCYTYVDNLMIDLIPSCAKPQYLTLSNYTTEGCDVSWTPMGSESSWEVVAVPVNTLPDNGNPEIAYGIPYTLTDLNDDTQYDVYVRAVCAGGDYSAWSFKQTFTTNPLCTSPQNVGVSQVAGTSALVHWEAAEYGATGYTVGYSEAGLESWTTQTVTGTSYMLSGLDPSTMYDVMVYSECPEGDADTVIAHFTTGCLVGGQIAIGTGTSTSSYLPSYSFYNYGYSQQLFTPQELGVAGNLTSVSMNMANLSQQRTFSIYLAHTTESSLSSSWITPTNPVQVFNSSQTLTTGWNTFNFSTPFAYNGTDNLLMIVIDQTGSYVSGNSWYAHSASGKARYTYQDGSAYSISSVPSASGTSSSLRNNVIFGAPCDSMATCVAPNPYIEDYDVNSVTVDWAPGYTENSWEMEYRPDSSTTWISEGIVTAPHTIDNLDPDTKYFFRIRSVCGGGDYSSWVSTSARTACTAISIPYTENFDDAPGSGSGNMVTCWTTGTNSTTAYPYTSTSYHASGEYSVYFYGTSAYYSYLASPMFDDNVDMTNLQVRFNAYKTSANYYIQVGIMTDPNDPSTFVQVGQNLTPSATSTWEMLEVNTNQYTGTGRYIAFRIPAVSSSNMYVDDITVDVIPACMHVTNITASNITPNSVDLSWTAGDDETNWVVVYGPAGSITDPENETSESASGTPEITLSNLSPSTPYDVFVKAVCSGTESSIWWQGSFNTACGEISVVPFTENFDGMGTGSSIYPNCWYRYNTYSTTTSYPYVSNSYHYSGNASLYFYTSTSTYNIAVLPPIDVTVLPINTLQVSFMMRSTSATTSTIQVGVMTDSANVNSFVPVESVHNTTTGVFEHFEVELSSYTGTGNYIALKLTNTASTYSVYLDDLVIELAPLCAKPTGVTASNVAATSADINWLPSGDETSWELVVVPAGASVTSGTPEPVAYHPYTIDNLNDNTAYDVYVRADCGTGTDFSSWSPVCHFTTPPLCSAPTNVTISQVEGTSALVTWTPAIFGATAYTIAYTETGMESWISQSVTGNSYMLTGLEPETPYTLTITSECDQGTAPAVTKTFNTPCLYGGDLQVGDGSTTNYYLPVNNFYHYTYSEQIFLASELDGAGELSSISFDYAYSSAMTDKVNVDIYLKHTTQSTFSSSSDYIDTAGAQLVYQGNLNCQQGWNTFNFTTPFQYNGTDNLVLIVDDNSDDYNGSAYVFHVHNAGATRSLYYYSDSYNPAPGNLSSFSGTKSTSANRSNVIFGTACDYTVTCIAPNVYVSDATENSLTIAWAPGYNESSWELEYSTDDSNWTSQGTVTTPPYTLSNLTPNTYYSVRMRSICGGGDYSNWTVVNHRTECAPIATVPFMENFDSQSGSTTTSVSVNNLPYCWSYLNEGTSTSYSGYPMVYTSATLAASGSNSMRFYTTTGTSYDDQIAILPAIDVDVLPLNTLQLAFDARNNSSYTFTLVIGVMTDPTDKATFTPISNIVTTSNTYTNYEIPLCTYSGTGAYIALKAPQPTSSFNSGYVDNIVLEPIPTCPKPTQVHSVTSTENSMELGWTENGTANTWIVEYGPHGFTLGNGTEVNVSSNPCTINNLTASTTYDFYVKADCGGGDLSNYSLVFVGSTECAAIDQLPFTENFDAVSGSTSTTAATNNLPLCWNYFNQGTSSSYSGYPIVYSSSSVAASGSNIVRFYMYTTSGTYDDQIAILPPIDATTYPINTLQLSFDARNYSSYTFTLVLGVMTNPADKTTFTPLDTIVTSSSSWTTYEIPLNQYSGTGNYIAMLAPKPSSSYNSGYVDNVVVDLIPSCPKPHNVTVSGITQSTATVSWNEVGSANSWNIKVNDGTNETTIPVSTNPYTLTNLSEASAYTISVQSICSASDVSDWSSTVSFNTECNAINTFPYTEDFENNGNIPTCWNQVYVQGTQDWTFQNGGHSSSAITSAHGGSYNAYIYNSSDNTTKLVSPIFDMSNLTNAYVTFWHAQPVWSSDQDELTVYYRTSPAAEWQQLVQYTSSLAAWTFDSIALPNTSATYQIAFEGYVTYGYGIDLDDITVNGTAGSGPVITIPTVTTNAATALGQDNATLNATITNPSGVTITAKGFEWKLTNGGTYTQITGTGTGNTFTANLTGLTPSTSYTYKAFIIYNGQTIYGTETSFTTLPQGVDPCDVPTGLHATNIENHAVTIAWDDNANVDNWNIQYRVAGSSTLSSATSSTNTYTITNLNGDSDYEIQVQADCGSGNLSDWSAAITVHTTNVGIENWLENSITLFPNPAKEYVDLRMDGNVNVTSMEVYDVYGKVIRTVNTIDNPTRINVNGLANGMYFVRVSTDAGVVTKTFVKK